MSPFPITSLKGLSGKEVENLASTTAHQLVVKALEAVKDREEARNAELFFCTLGLETIVAAKMTALLTIQHNEHVSNDGLKELANSIGADIGVELAEKLRKHLSAVFEGKAEVRNVKLKKQ